MLFLVTFLLTANCLRIYLVICTFCYATLGWPHVWSALGWYNVCTNTTDLFQSPDSCFSKDSWPHRVPSVFFLLLYILSSVICLAVSIMSSWHIWSIANAETSVEAHDHEEYRRLAKGRGEVCSFITNFMSNAVIYTLAQEFINSYDVG